MYRHEWWQPICTPRMSKLPHNCVLSYSLTHLFPTTNKFPTVCSSHIQKALKLVDMFPFTLKKKDWIFSVDCMSTLLMTNKALSFLELQVALSTAKALKWSWETRKRQIWGANQTADVRHSKNRNSTKSSTSIVHKLLQVIVSVLQNARLVSLKQCRQDQQRLDGSIAIRSLKGGLKIEAVTLTRTWEGECKRKSHYRTARAFQVWRMNGLIEERTDDCM